MPYGEEHRKAVCGKTACTVVRPAKAGMFSRRQSCRGKSQEPRSLDSRVAGNQDPEAYRQSHLEGGCELSGRNASERKVASLMRNSGGRALSRGAKTALERRNLTEATYHSSGVVATAR